MGRQPTPLLPSLLSLVLSDVSIRPTTKGTRYVSGTKTGLEVRSVYWFHEESGEVFCLAEAPNKEAAEAVHREAHGLVADELTEVKEGS